MTAIKKERKKTKTDVMGRKQIAKWQLYRADISDNTEQDPTICCVQETELRLKDTNRLKAKDGKDTPLKHERAVVNSTVGIDIG